MHCQLPTRSAAAMSARPELVAPPEIFYNAEEARKYTSNSHMIETQAGPQPRPSIHLCRERPSTRPRQADSLLPLRATPERLTERALELLALRDDGPKVRRGCRQCRVRGDSGLPPLAACSHFVSPTRLASSSWT
jgi:hypothetical protein